MARKTDKAALRKAWHKYYNNPKNYERRLAQQRSRYQVHEWYRQWHQERYQKMKTEHYELLRTNQYGYEIDYLRTPKGQYKSLKHRANKHKQPFLLELKDIEKVLSEPKCHWCDLPPTKCGRLSADNGYEVDNMIPLCDNHRACKNYNEKE